MLNDLSNRNKWINSLELKFKNFGSCFMQVVFITYRIIKLQKHILIYKKDFHNKRGLLKLIFRRRRMLKYIKSCDLNQYYFLIKKLNLRY